MQACAAILGMLPSFNSIFAALRGQSESEALYFPRRAVTMDDHTQMYRAGRYIWRFKGRGFPFRLRIAAQDGKCGGSRDGGSPSDSDLPRRAANDTPVPVRYMVLPFALPTH